MKVGKQRASLVNEIVDVPLKMFLPHAMFAHYFANNNARFNELFLGDFVDPVHPFVRLCVRPFVRASVRPSVRPSVRSSVLTRVDPSPDSRDCVCHLA